MDDEEQSENCLNLSMYIPASVVSPDEEKLATRAKVPVVVFIHGGAYFLGSGNRPYYSPISFLQHAIQTDKPIMYVAINYRLGALGFWAARTPSGNTILAENNGLYDQLRALEWIKTNIASFGGDPDNVTALGQSAGGESLSILSMSDEVREGKLYRKAIALSGTMVTMPAMTPAEHTQNFLEQAEKLDISTPNRTIEDIAQDVRNLPVSTIRKLAWVGSPCTRTSLFPFEKPSMRMMRNGGPDAWKNRRGGGKGIGIEALIVGSTTYDGGISFNMMSRDERRKGHADAFAKISREVLGDEMGRELCDIYDIRHSRHDSNATPSQASQQDDREALQRICLFESDIGFFFAALASCQSNLIPQTYLQIFDLPNPFDGPLKSVGEYATHTFDITTLLGGYDESLLPKGYGDVIGEWRSKILDFVYDGTAPCALYREGDGGGKALLVGKDGVRDVGREAYMGSDGGRRQELMDLAEKVDKENGWDVLWVDVCRRFLMKGE